MKKKKKTILFCLCLALGIYWLLDFPFMYCYTYESSDRGMAELECPSKGRNLEVVQAQFEDYKTWKNDSTLRLYRTSKPDWTKPWLWVDNIKHERWSIPYIKSSPNPNNKYYVEMRNELQNEKK